MGSSQVLRLASPLRARATVESKVREDAGRESGLAFRKEEALMIRLVGSVRETRCPWRVDHRRLPRSAAESGADISWTDILHNMCERVTRYATSCNSKEMWAVLETGEWCYPPTRLVVLTMVLLSSYSRCVGRADLLVIYIAAGNLPTQFS